MRVRVHLDLVRPHSSLRLLEEEEGEEEPGEEGHEDHGEECSG